MNGVSGEPPLQDEAAFFQSSGRWAIFDIAGRFDPEDFWLTQGDGCKRLNCFAHQTLAPLAAREHIADVHDVAMRTRLEHADELTVRFQRDDVRKRRARVSMSNAASEEIARGLQRGMWLQNDVPRDIRILGVRGKHFLGV